MAGRGGNSNSAQERMGRSRTSRSALSRVPGNPTGPMPRPTGDLAYDSAQMNRWRADNARNAANGIRWEPTREQLPVTRPQTQVASGGSGGPPALPPRTALAAPEPTPGPSGGGGRSLALRNNFPALSPNSGSVRGRAGAGIAAAAAAAPILAMGLRERAENTMNARYGRPEDHPVMVAARHENAPPEINTPMLTRRDAPSTPTRPVSRPQARPQAEQMSPDRLNEMSLALARGEDPMPRNSAEVLAVNRMRERMGNPEMAMGGMMMPRMPKPPKASTPKNKAPTAKKPKMPGTPRPGARMPRGTNPLKMSKGGTTKGKKK